MRGLAACCAFVAALCGAPLIRAASPPSPQAPAQHVTQTDTRILARLVNPGTPTSHCGVFHFKPVMRFELIEVRTGEAPVPHTEPGDPIYIAVSCPEMAPTGSPGFAFATDEVYEVVIDPRGLRPGGMLVDAFEGQGGRRHELLWIDVPGAP